MIRLNPSFGASRSPINKRPFHDLWTAKKMKSQIVKKTICLLIAIAFSIPIARAQSRGYTIQVESAPSEAEARSSVARLRAQGLEAYWVKAEIPGIGVRYRIRVGRYQYLAQARAKADQLLSSGAIKEFIVTTYDAPSSDSGAPGELKPDTEKPAPVSAGPASEPRKGNRPPKVKIEIGPGDAPPRKTSNAEPA